MKTSRLIALVVFSLLVACLPKKPELPMTEVPAGPLLHALEQQRLSFTGLKALASVQVTGGFGRRAFDTVGIVIDGQRRLRLEAFDPLGRALIILVWNGQEFLLRVPEDEKNQQPGRVDIEKVLGVNVEGSELCAALSGVVQEIAKPSMARASCAQDGACVLEISGNGTTRRVRMTISPGALESSIRVAEQELYQSGSVVYRASYTRKAGLSTVLPGTVRIENPSKSAAFFIDYIEADMNVPVEDKLFTLSGKENRAP